MKLDTITVCRDHLEFALEDAFTGTLTLEEWEPTVHGEAKLLDSAPLAFADGRAQAPRFAGVHDRTFGRFVLRKGGQTLPGVCYVTDLAPDVAENRYPYPQPDTIKTLSCRHEVGARFGVKQSRFDVSLPQYMSLVEQPGTVPFAFEGRTYYFFEEELANLEEHLAGYEVNTLIMLNAPRLFGSRREKELLDVCIHPRYEWNDPGAFISAFNMTTAAGWQVYGAFISFFAQRYTRTDAKYGRVGGMIISNEINLQRSWGNTGPTPVEDYMEEYTQALRMAWLCGRRYYSDFRVYVSLANNWNVLHEDPLRYYHGRDVLDWLGRLCARDGDFGWHVAFHPYCESWLPDFWDDRGATFDFSTRSLTFKNMEVLEAYLAQPQLLYRGAPRRILFSEQGFNAASGPLQALHEKQGAAGYVLAYLKARNMKTVDMFTHHALVDNPHEFGLNLGIFRLDAAAPDGLGEPKPIAQAVMAMDTPAEGMAIAFAREVIDPALFDWLLHPQVRCGEQDTSSETDFGLPEEKEEG